MRVDVMHGVTGVLEGHVLSGFVKPAPARGALVGHGRGHRLFRSRLA